MYLRFLLRIKTARRKEIDLSEFKEQSNIVALKPLDADKEFFVRPELVYGVFVSDDVVLFFEREKRFAIDFVKIKMTYVIFVSAFFQPKQDILAAPFDNASGQHFPNENCANFFFLCVVAPFG